MLESGDRTGIERLLTSAFKESFTLDDLDIDLPKGAS
jgi:hypothetical protein